MNRYLTILLALGLLAALLAGCTDGGNVSENKDGLIDTSASSQTLPTEDGGRTEPTGFSLPATSDNTEHTRTSGENASTEQPSDESRQRSLR